MINGYKKYKGPLFDVSVPSSILDQNYNVLLPKKLCQSSNYRKIWIIGEIRDFLKMERICTTGIIGLGMLACAPRGGGWSEAGHCLHLLFSFSFWSRRACVRHPWWQTKRSWPLFSPTFFFFFFLFSFYAFCFSPTSEKLPWLKICFPQYFGITRRYSVVTSGN